MLSFAGCATSADPSQSADGGNVVPGEVAQAFEECVEDFGLEEVVPGFAAMQGNTEGQEGAEISLDELQVKWGQAIGCNESSGRSSYVDLPSFDQVFGVPDEELADENAVAVEWAGCLSERGWDVGEPTANAVGYLEYHDLPDPFPPDLAADSLQCIELADANR